MVKKFVCNIGGSYSYLEKKLEPDCFIADKHRDCLIKERALIVLHLHDFVNAITSSFRFAFEVSGSVRTGSYFDVC